jgi:hypothetical protein
MIYASKICLSPSKCIELITLGIEPRSIFMWVQCDVGLFDIEFSKIELGSPVLTEWTPAWTYEELRVMIGNRLTPGYIDIPFRMNNRDHLLSSPEDVVFRTQTIKKEQGYVSAAEAAGQTLIELIKAGQVDPNFANKRFATYFKIQ